MKLEYTIGYGDIVRWRSNERVPPENVLFTFLQNGNINLKQYNASMEELHLQTLRIIAEYRAAALHESKKLQAARQASISVNFKKGAKVVDLFTGQEWVE
jgi:hypothetical protein